MLICDTAHAHSLLQARYSGLVDVLQFSEADFAEGLAGHSIWVAANADPSALQEQVAAAEAAGITRIFAVLSSEAERASITALETTLSSSGMTYTIMRTGKLTSEGAGSGLKLGEIDLPVCEDVNKDDIFRFVTEALTLSSAYARSFTVCPSADDSQLKQMRFAGCDRREEIDALLRGQITERSPDEMAASEQTAEQEEEVEQLEAEDSLAREEELKMLLARAKERGIENQKKMAAEEAEKAAKREERAMYFNSLQPREDDEGKGSDSGEAPTVDSGDDKPPGGDDNGDDKPDDDGLVAA